MVSKCSQTHSCPLSAKASVLSSPSSPERPPLDSHLSDKLPSNSMSTSSLFQLAIRSLINWKCNTFAMIEFNRLSHLLRYHALKIIIFLTSGPEKIWWLFSIVYDVVISLVDQVAFLRWRKVWFFVVGKTRLHPLWIVDTGAPSIKWTFTQFSWSFSHVSVKQMHQGGFSWGAWFYPILVKDFNWTCCKLDRKGVAYQRTCACKWWAFFSVVFWQFVGESTFPEV